MKPITISFTAYISHYQLQLLVLYMYSTKLICTQNYILDVHVQCNKSQVDFFHPLFVIFKNKTFHLYVFARMNERVLPHVCRFSMYCIILPKCSFVLHYKVLNVKVQYICSICSVVFELDFLLVSFISRLSVATFKMLTEEWCR